MAERGLARFDTIDGKLHEVRLFGLKTEGRGDRMQRSHPGQRTGFGRACAPAHRFRPRKSADDDGKNFGEHINGRTTRLFDQRDVKVALLRVALDLRFVQRGEPRGFQKTSDGSLRPADTWPFSLFL